MPCTARLTNRLFAAALAAATALAGAAVSTAAPRPPLTTERAPAFADTVAAVADMVDDEGMTELVNRAHLDLVNVMWEDTGRWEGSSVGPNISDVTIEVEAAPGQTRLMPVIRNANFADKTADVKLDRIFVPVGNQAGGKLTTISLAELLRRPGRYLSQAKAGTIKGGTLLAKRDSHALVSAQHAFLPVPASGQVNFWPVIFNYQSYEDNPAVLTILVTRQGTSMTIVDNTRDTTAGGSWGQRLYFNQDGQKAPLLAERLKDVQAKGTTANGEAAASLGEDANLLMLIQVPLKQKARPRLEVADDEGEYADGAMPAPPPKSASASAPMAMQGGASVGSARTRRADVDTAVLGHGETTGPFTELDGQTIERDPRFPVRVTVQFYQATATGVVAAPDIERMAAQIGRVYAKGDYVGSLVVPGPKDRARPTNYGGDGAAHFGGLDAWWARFGGRPQALKGN
ncbi:MAG: hypothetical protein R3B06_31545 [Kofleriaceae bacterium]